MFKHEGYEIHVDQYGKFWAVVDEAKVSAPSLAEMQKEIHKRLKAKRIKISIPVWLYIDGKTVSGRYCGVHKGWNAHTFTIGKGKLQSCGFGGIKMFRNKEDAGQYRDLVTQKERLEEEIKTLVLDTSHYIQDYDDAVANEATMVKRLAGD